MNTEWSSETRAFYESRGITARGGLGASPAVLVVDMTEPFTDPGHPVGSNQTDSVAAIARLLPAARAQRVPIVFTSLAFRPGVEDAVTWGHKMPALHQLRVDEPSALRIDPRLAPEPGDLVINKRAPSAFFGTGLVALLIPKRIDTVIVTGCATSGCIRATVVDALSYGFRVAIAEECVSDRAQAPHEANLFDMDAKYGDVMGLAEVTAYLESLDPRR